MSVIVEFDIGGGGTYRRFEIHNASALSDANEYDIECIYVVDVANNRLRGANRRAVFTHRRSDDVTQLVAAAGEALRQRYGHV